MPFGLVVRFVVKDGAVDEFDRLVAETVRAIRENEPETLIYACHAVHAQPGQRIFYELYQDREAFDRHERQPHIERFLAERQKYLESTTVDFLTPQASKGIPVEEGSRGDRA